MRLGILSDTHNLLRPEVLTTLTAARVDHILHAGDIGNPSILDELAEIAPVTAIHGNIDLPSIAPATQAIEFEGHLFYMIHSLADLDLNPQAAHIAAVITGHSHKPLIETRAGILYLNPGSCGPKRFKLPTTLALLEATHETLTPTLITLL